MGVKTAKELLGLTCAESIETIKLKWRKRMKENHPDLYMEQGGGEAVNQATERSKRINEAYEFSIRYIELFGHSDFETCDEKEKSEDAYSDVWIEDEVFDRTFSDSLFSILLGFDHPDSNLIKNIQKYNIVIS